jgi:hypothetical protein
MERLGRAKRQLAIWTAVTTAVVVAPGVALAGKNDPDRGWGGHRGGEGGPGLTVEGKAVSQAANEAWVLGIRGRSGAQASEAGGYVRFGHRAPDGASDGLMGRIRCLSKDGAGVIQVTGTVERSGSRPAPSGSGAPAPGQPGGQNPGADPSQLLGQLAGSVGSGGDHGPGQAGALDGKDFAFTIDVPGNPQRFSLPKTGDPGTLSACSAGANQLVPVTRGGFRSTESQGG